MWVLELLATLNRISKHMNKLLFLFFISLFPLAFAEEENEENTSSPNQQQTETQNDKTSSTTVNTPDSFDPTETLSQDVPTAFPVDI